MAVILQISTSIYNVKVSKNKIYIVILILGFIAIQEPLFLVIFCLIFQFTVFHHLPQHVIYTVIYIVGLFFLKAKFGKERGEVNKHFESDVNDVTQNMQMNHKCYIYTYMICVRFSFRKNVFYIFEHIIFFYYYYW